MHVERLSLGLAGVFALAIGAGVLACGEADDTLPARSPGPGPTGGTESSTDGTESSAHLPPGSPSGSSSGSTPSVADDAGTSGTDSAAPVTKGRVYPMHTKIVATTFWVGELFNAALADGSQVCSTYDSDWAFHWSGVNKGKVTATA
jgi:hypothetical protein